MNTFQPDVPGNTSSAHGEYLQSTELCLLLGMALLGMILRIPSPDSWPLQFTTTLQEQYLNQGNGEGVTPDLKLGHKVEDRIQGGLAI